MAFIENLFKNAFPVIQANSSYLLYKQIPVKSLEIFLWNYPFKSWRCFWFIPLSLHILCYIQIIFYVTTNTLESATIASFLFIVAEYHCLLSPATSCWKPWMASSSSLAQMGIYYIPGTHYIPGIYGNILGFYIVKLWKELVPLKHLVKLRKEFSANDTSRQTDIRAKMLKIIFLSESMASLLGYMPTSLHNTTLYEIVADNDKVFSSYFIIILHHHTSSSYFIIILHHHHNDIHHNNDKVFSSYFIIIIIMIRYFNHYHYHKGNFIIKNIHTEDYYISHLLIISVDNDDNLNHLDNMKYSVNTNENYQSLSSLQHPGHEI